MYIIEITFRGSGSWRSFSSVLDAVKFGEARAHYFMERAQKEGLVVRKEDLRISLREEKTCL